ncbi:MAG: hypothetical protein KGY61_11955 [Desulfobacterales bacterium]|nr:hypothetical protein [Desulfobacterales bacterium]
MKTIANISLGSDRDDYDFNTQFMGQDFRLLRFGANGDSDKAAELIKEWDSRVDAIGLGSFTAPYGLGMKGLKRREAEKLNRLRKQLSSPLTTGDTLREVSHEWSIRHIQHKFGNNYFNNKRILFFSGMITTPLARILSEYTDNLTFCDPITENGIPKFLTSMDDLKLYAKGLHDILGWLPSKKFSNFAFPIQNYNDFLISKAIQEAQIIVAPYYKFYNYLGRCGLKELGRKVVITATAYDDRVNFLKERGVDMIIDTTPKIMEKVVGVSVLEAMIMAGLDKTPETLTSDDLLEVITDLRMDPRVIYPQGEARRVNRFAFVVYPLSREYLKNFKPVKLASKFSPKSGMDAIEKIAAYSPPFIYSKVTGVKSPTGVEAEGWLIALGATPRQMLAHGPEFLNNRLLKATEMAKNMGAQIIGLGTLTKPLGDAGETVAKLSNIPVTTGNSYSASAAMWAAAEAVRKLGLIKMDKGKKMKAKTMVIGATGAVGSVCCRLLATAFDEVYMIDIHHAELLALKEWIMNETPEVNIQISTRADKFLADMDVVILTSAAMKGKNAIDIHTVKPGCVITDVNRPLYFTAKDAKKRPDVLIIASGEITLPGEPEMRDIGLPPGVAYASLAETIVLALEGRFENFSVGRNMEWQKVSEIYKMGLKHDMQLAGISGLDGPISDTDFKRVRELAIKSRKPSRQKKKSSPSKSRKK